MGDGSLNGSLSAFVTTPRAWAFTSSFRSNSCCPRFSYGIKKGIGRTYISPAHIYPIQAVEKEAGTATENTGESDEWHPLFLKHLGIWEGYYRKIDPKTGDTTETHRSYLEVGIRGHRYSQRNTYTWDDGRVEEHIFPGCLLEGQFIIESPRLKGFAHVLLDDALVFYAQFKQRQGDVICTIRLLTPTKRARTWQVREGDDIVEIVHIEEEKTSSEDVYFETSGTPWD